MNNQIKPGTVVQLKSGGPKMTAVGVQPSESDADIRCWKCYWFAGDEVRSAIFREALLTPRQ